MTEETAEGAPASRGAANISAASGPSGPCDIALAQSAGKTPDRRLCGPREAVVQAPGASYTAAFRSDRSLAHETYVPAKEAQARPYPRFPRAHADPRGAPHAQAPARQGPQAPDRLMPGGRETTVSPQRSSRGRLSRSAEFARVFRQGRSHAGRDLVLYVFARGEEEGEPRLGLAVGRKVGGAVQRNRVKRVLREAFALESERLPAGSDAVVIARSGAGELAARAGLSGVRAALAELIDKVPGAAERAGAAVGGGAGEHCGEAGERAEGTP